MANYILFGGTFDPIHNGHIRMATYASMKLNADVVFVPARSPRWKNPTSSSKERLKMLKAALKYCPSGSSILDYELKSKDDINYSIDTVRYFKNMHPNDKIYFLIGADQVNRFAEWKSAEELSKLATIIFSSRPNIDLDQDIINHYNMVDIKFYESGEVSSTKVRQLKSLDIPQEVCMIIENDRLYYINKLSKYITNERLEHSIQVAHLAYAIAVKNKLDNPYKYYIAGLLHDAGKTMQIDQVKFMEDNFPMYIDLPKFSYHQFLGAYLAEHEFGIEDEEILTAIRNHCTGNKNMSPISMVVYASDKIEPTRGFDSRFLIDSCMKNYKQGFIDTLIDNKKYLLAHNKDITNELTNACFEMYINK